MMTNGCQAITNPQHTSVHTVMVTYTGETQCSCASERGGQSSESGAIARVDRNDMFITSYYPSTPYSRIRTKETVISYPTKLSNGTIPSTTIRTIVRNEYHIDSIVWAESNSVSIKTLPSDLPKEPHNTIS